MSPDPNISKSNSNSAIVEEQSALIARGGTLVANVSGNTGLTGGIIAALDADGKDSGKLNLTTGTLTASDIKDSAKSKSIGVGVSINFNDVTEKGVKGANLPVGDASFSSSTFKQDTKATIGQGTLTVGVPAENVTINRDVGTSQVVTKDKATGFTFYADVAAAKELVSLVKGVAGNDDAKANSTILNAVSEIKKDFDGKGDTSSTLVSGVKAEIGALGGLDRTDSKLDFLFLRAEILVRGAAAVQSELRDNLVNFARAVAAADPELQALPIAEREEKIDLLERVARNTADLQIAAAREGGRFVFSNDRLDGAISDSGVGRGAPVPAPRPTETANLSLAQSGSVTGGQADTPQPAPLVEQPIIVIGTPLGRPSTSGVLELGLELTGRVAADPIVQRLSGALDRALSFTPRGALTNLGTGVLNRVAPDTVQALSNNITELQTRIGVTVDTVVTGDRAADVRRDFDTAPTSDNAFEVGGGKAVTAAATTVLLGSIARRLNNGDGADGPDPSRRPSTIQERREHHDNRVTDVANEYRAQGYDIPNERQATFGSQCGGRNSCRTDLIGRDPNGRVVVFEIKTGDAQLSIRQSDIYPQIRNGNAIPTGAVAENLGLRPGVRLRDQDYPNGIRIIEERRPGLGQ